MGFKIEVPLWARIAGWIVLALLVVEVSDVVRGNAPAEGVPTSVASKMIFGIFLLACWLVMKSIFASSTKGSDKKKKE